MDRAAPSRVPAAVIAALLLGALSAGSPGDGLEHDAEIEMSPISGDPQAPRRHFRLRHPAIVGDEEALAAYALARGYAASGLEEAAGYLDWQRHDRVPYLSTTHGNHYLSNYVNERAAPYYETDARVPMPVGSIIAKDSFSVTRTGGIILGPLFVMEKMPPGFDPGRGDWRYTLVQPNGRLIGRTGDPSGERVEYCVACHLAAEAKDYLYGVPPAARRGG